MGHTKLAFGAPCRGHLVVTFTLVVFVFTYEIGYKMHFLAMQPLAVEAHGRFTETMTNWWACNDYDGSCIYERADLLSTLKADIFHL